MPTDILAMVKAAREWLNRMNVTQLTVTVTIDNTDSYTIVLRKG